MESPVILATSFTESFIEPSSSIEREYMNY
jgi:hypothetical protein